MAAAGLGSGGRGADQQQGQGGGEAEPRWSSWGRIAPRDRHALPSGPSPDGGVNAAERRRTMTVRTSRPEDPGRGDGGMAMTLHYAVGIRLKDRADQVTIEAEDALIAALRVKAAHPEAAITYVRKRNARGDRRHPHAGAPEEDPAGAG